MPWPISLLFAARVDEKVLGQIPVRQHFITIPKTLRFSFEYDRKLPGELSRCYYDSIKEIFLPSGLEILMVVHKLRW